MSEAVELEVKVKVKVKVVEWLPTARVFPTRINDFVNERWICSQVGYTCASSWVRPIEKPTRRERLVVLDFSTCRCSLSTVETPCAVQYLCCLCCFVSSLLNDP